MANDTQSDNPGEKESGFKESMLNEDQLMEYLFVKDRIDQLKRSRQNHYGRNLDTLWREADRDYIPHRLKIKGTRVVATDEEKGLRGSMVNLGTSDWQVDSSEANVFIKIQTALSILVDQNPSAVFTATRERFTATNELMKQLYQQNWERARSKSQLKLFVMNLAKYGWATGRTLPLKLNTPVKSLVEYNEEDPESSVYEKRDVTEYNDVFRENLDPRNAWIDDMAKPNNSFSIRDWTWRKVYDFDDAKKEFGKYERFKHVKPGGATTETIGNNKGKEYVGKRLTEVFFYENRVRDIFMVIINGVPVVIEPLPISNINGSKKLSLWQTYWMLRHSESPFGIGVYEAIRYDHSLLDRFRNMSMDQLTLSIYKMFFYQGTQGLQDTGQITISPGVGKQVLDPKNITWMDVPGPGKEAFQGIEMMRKAIDDASGITPQLQGEVQGKTAFESAQAKESALKRLKNPLDNILEALNEEAYITIAVMQLIYSIPEVRELTDERLIDDYLRETESDDELFDREDVENEDGTVRTRFFAKIFPEFPLALDKDEKGNLIETEDTKFFRIKPRFLKWDGIINVKAQSILAPSKQVEKALDLEFYNMFIPLLTQLAQERLIVMESGNQSPSFDSLPHGKAAKDLAKLYDKDPRDVFPDEWLAAPEQPQQEDVNNQDEDVIVQSPQSQPPVEEPLVIPPPETGAQAEQPNAERFVSQATGPDRSQGIVGRVVNRLTKPFRR